MENYNLIDDVVNKIYEVEMQYIDSINCLIYYTILENQQLKRLLDEKIYPNIEEGKFPTKEQFLQFYEKAKPGVLKGFDSLDSQFEEIGRMRQRTNKSKINNRLINVLQNYSNRRIDKLETSRNLRRDSYNYFMEALPVINFLEKLASSINPETSNIGVLERIKKVNGMIDRKVKTVQVPGIGTLDTLINLVTTEDEALKFIGDIDYILSVLYAQKEEQAKSSIEQHKIKVKVPEMSEEDSLIQKIESIQHGLNEDIKFLAEVNIFPEEFTQILNRKNEFDNNFPVGFTQSSDITILSQAHEKISEISDFVDKLKQNIAGVLVYEGLNIEDVLREDVSFLARDYAKKLKELSSLYSQRCQDVLEGENNASSLADLYKKLMSMYELIDVMKNNTYNPDEASRFSK